MLGPPHLEVRRPSPTTVEFVVTTQPRRTGWTGWALAAAVVVVRMLLAASAGVALWAHANQDVVRHLRRGTLGADMTWQNLVWHLFVSAHGLDALRAAASSPPWLVLPLCLVAFWASVARVHTSESLLVLRGLGIQTRSTGATYLGELVSGLSVVWWTLTTPWTLIARFFSISTNDRGGGGATAADGYYGEPTPAATRFIPTEKLQDLLVNEAFRGFEVRYYLVAVVAGRGAGPIGGEGLGVRVKNARLLEESEEEGEYRDEKRDSNGYSNGRDRHDGGYDSDDSDNESDGPDGGGSSSEEDEDHIVVVFPRLLPGLDIVRTVWREARACLYEPDARG
ncbi:hypothetical protein Sste5346_001831 [Sporothrix stenoceras]|uniref:Phosphatidylinositol N-acetylglucosaminyltransferase subunit H conserved domain-containing protein n=1 Tax=Sporothrix stenoceras TaxID=5173 RepID=A0ABR3ZL82_9PEZI